MRRPFDDQRRAGRMRQHTMGHAAEHGFSNTAAASSADDDKVGRDGVGTVENDLGGAADLIDLS